MEEQIQYWDYDAFLDDAAHYARENGITFDNSSPEQESVQETLHALILATTELHDSQEPPKEFWRTIARTYGEFRTAVIEYRSQIDKTRTYALQEEIAHAKLFLDSGTRNHYNQKTKLQHVETIEDLLSLFRNPEADSASVSKNCFK